MTPIECNSIVTNDIEWTNLVAPPPGVIDAFSVKTSCMFYRIAAGLLENEALITPRLAPAAADERTGARGVTVCAAPPNCSSPGSNPPARPNPHHRSTPARVVCRHLWYGEQLYRSSNLALEFVRKAGRDRRPSQHALRFVRPFFKSALLRAARLSH